jgi:S-formylglutathione hydrolase
MAPEVVSESRSFGGTQYVYRHASAATGTPMRFAAYVPHHAGGERLPVVWFLSGLSCTEENFTLKAGAQRVAAELGLILIVPDTSPRGESLPDDPAGAYDLGLGAGFYLNATEKPWSTHYRMRTYLESELPELVFTTLPVDPSRQGITGHSMGGHGALTLALRNPGRYAAVSALAPIGSPTHCPWGQKALTNYLGADQARWREYDATALIEDGARLPDLLIDQGGADQFRQTQLMPWLLVSACQRAGIPLTYREHEGYDHSYFFVASFIEQHLRWQAERLHSR